MLALAPLRRKAEQQGSREFSPHWAGQAAPLGSEMPAEALTRALAETALRRFRQLAGLRTLAEKHDEFGGYFELLHAA